MAVRQHLENAVQAYCARLLLFLCWKSYLTRIGSFVVCPPGLNYAFWIFWSSYFLFLFCFVVLMMSWVVFENPFQWFYSNHPRMYKRIWQIVQTIAIATNWFGVKDLSPNYPKFVQSMHIVQCMISLMLEVCRRSNSRETRNRSLAQGRVLAGERGLLLNENTKPVSGYFGPQKKNSKICVWLGRSYHHHDYAHIIICISDHCIPTYMYSELCLRYCKKHQEHAAALMLTLSWQ